MAVQRMDHVGVIVDDLPAAIEFFVALGLELEGEMSIGDDERVDRLLGLDGVRTEFAFVRAPDGTGLELIKFKSPAHGGAVAEDAANVPGLRHVTFAVDDIEATLARLRERGAELVGELVNYDDSYWLCYVRGPAGIIVELAQKIG